MTSLGCLASITCFCNNNGSVPPCPIDVAFFLLQHCVTGKQPSTCDQLPSHGPTIRKPTSMGGPSNSSLHTAAGSLHLTSQSEEGLHCCSHQASASAAVTKQLLKSVVFHNSSLEGLIGLGNSFSSSGNAVQAVLASEKGSTPRSYHSQLLQV